MNSTQKFLSIFKGHKIIFFDGVCNLCNASVDFLVQRDASRLYKYASLQSEVGQYLLTSLNKSTSDFDSFIYVFDGNVYTESGAAIRVLGGLGGFWSLMKVFLIVPAFIRNAVYSFIAKNRYQWFGKKETCRLPSPEERGLFLEELSELGVAR